MLRGRWATPLGIFTLAFLPGVMAEGPEAVIIASVIAGLLLVCLVVGITIFCLYKNGQFSKRPDKKRRKNKHAVYVQNGGPPPLHFEKRANGYHKSNGYSKQKLPPPLQPAFIEPVPVPMPPPHRVQMRPPPMHYQTYHGPPPDMANYASRAGTVSGPPPIVIPFGTVAVRPDPRPVVHKASRKRSPVRKEEGRRSASPRRHSPQRRAKSQEFVIQQSYDGIPVIRPVIYVDDDEYDRQKHRSKSRERRYKKRSKDPSPAGATVTEVQMDSNKMNSTTHETRAEVEPTRESRPRTTTPPPSHGIRSAERSRASSVTEAVNQLRMSVKGVISGDDSDDSSDSNAPSFNWTKSHTEQRAPDPVAGDVMFLPAGTKHESKHLVNREPTPPPSRSQRQQDDDPYVYTKVIKTSSTREDPAPFRRSSPVQAEVPKSTTFANEGYEIPVSRNANLIGTRDEEPKYMTEHTRQTGIYSHIGASMSDRLQNLVEDGDKTRFTHYNVGAINFDKEEETEDEIEPSQLRTRRPDTPPETDHIYARAIKRPRTPPNDIPLVSPRESTEVPPLNLQSAVASPRDESLSYRPATPPKDFPITPQHSFLSKRPRTPPTDFPITPKAVTRPPTPPYDAQETARSAAVDPTTGEPGSFQARQRLIEAHLLKNAGGSNVPAPKPKTQTTSPAKTVAPAPPPPVPTVHVTPGVVPPAPPPPPLPK